MVFRLHFAATRIKEQQIYFGTILLVLICVPFDIYFANKYETGGPFITGLRHFALASGMRFLPP